MRLTASLIVMSVTLAVAVACGSSTEGLDSLDTAVDTTAETETDSADDTAGDGIVVHDVDNDGALDVGDAAEVGPDTTDHAPLLCRPCQVDGDCSAVDAGARCVLYGAPGAFCGVSCATADDCPALHDCVDAATVGGATALQCVPVTGLCACRPEFVQGGFATFCENVNAWGSCKGQRVCTAEGLGDCDALTPQEELCNGVDDDCDGVTDEDVDVSTGVAPCRSVGVCAAGVPVTCAGGEWACDYASVAGYSDVDGHCGECQDNDCDGATDEDFVACAETGPDLDCDAVLATDNCPGVANADQLNSDGDAAGDACDTDDDNDGVADVDDCAPLNSAVYPQATEACDGLDTNCNGVTDETFADTDDDGQADCVDGDDDDDGVADADDCAPLDAARFPGNPEVCDGQDQDCDEVSDEGALEGVPLACSLIGGEAGVCQDGACVDPCEAGVDVPDDDFADTNCDGLDGDRSRAVFVAPLQHGGDDFNPGTSDLPKLTLQAAIDTALAEGKTQVLASAATYEGPVTLAAGIGVYGGYHKPVGWLRAPEYETTLEVTAPDAQGNQVGVVAHDLSTDTPTAFDRFRVVLADNTAAGGSNYGVHAVDAPGLVLSNVTLEVGKGGDGVSRTTPGAKPSAYGWSGAYGDSGHESDSWPCEDKYSIPDAGTGANAPTCPYGPASGSGGTGGYAGWGSGSGGSGNKGNDNGDHSAVGGTGGPNYSYGAQPGATGANGPAGADASGGLSFGAFVGGFLVTEDGGAAIPAADGASGAGGGGGAGGDGGVTDILKCRGHGGAGGGGGSGGCGGQRGQSGDGGGAVFAVLALGAQPGLRALTVTLGGGGKGGDASAGGQGTTGGSGGSGGSTWAEGANSGASGGKGGDGGRGGHGGGGGGGPSFCVYYVLDSGEPDPALLNGLGCTNGGGGAGGASVGNPGAKGAEGEIGFCLAGACAL